MDVDKNGVVEIVKAYPQGEERKAINAAFDNLIAELKKELVFTHTEETPSLPLRRKSQNSFLCSERISRPYSVSSRWQRRLRNRLLLTIKAKSIQYKAVNIWMKRISLS